MLSKILLQSREDLAMFLFEIFDTNSTKILEDNEIDMLLSTFGYALRMLSFEMQENTQLHKKKLKENEVNLQNF